MQVPAEKSRVFRFGVFEADLQEAELRKNGVCIRLQEQPFKILTILLEHPGQIVSREELQEQLWSADTFADVDNSLNNTIKKLREALGDDSENPRFIQTLHRRGYRFIAPVDGPRDAAAVERTGEASRARDKSSEGMRKFWRVIAPAFVILVAVAAGTYFYSHRAPKLTDRDKIVIADFTNTTGDPIFDGTLRQGLAVQLEQSPFFSLVSDQQIQRTLQMMKQPPDARLTPEIAREVCQRTGSAAVLGGSIAQIGTQYSLILKAVNCANGESLTSTETQASDKNQVLQTLGRASSDMRKKLGESISSVQKFDRPLEQATTSSLEAIQAYSLGLKLVARGDDAASMPFFQQAIKLDPNFAMAYAMIAGRYYFDSGETTLASKNMRKAFELRASVSERERLEIETSYHQIVTGDLLKAQQVCEVWVQTYPRDWEAPNMLGVIYDLLGQPEKALAEYREALRLYPDSGLILGNILYDYFSLDRLNEARAMADEMNGKQIDVLFDNAYVLAFLQNDRAGMAQQVASAVGKVGLEDLLLGDEADTAAYCGQLEKARGFSRQAVASAERAREAAAAAGYEAEAALRESLFGYPGEARQWATSALRHSNARDRQYGAALALALAGDRARAQALAVELGKRFPEDTTVQFSYMPTLRAQLALNHNDAAKAIETLEAAAPYELAVGLYPAYFRGVAYLAERRSAEAASEFQKILDHRGVVRNSPIAALARLQIGRAYSMAGDTAKAKVAYQDFFALWKDADPGIPILKQAKAEYAKLQ